jgi:hypothetical protein
MGPQIHCQRHASYQPGCNPCQDAKIAFYRPRNALADFLGAEPVEPKLPVQQPVARKADPETSHQAAALKQDEAGLWQDIMGWLKSNGPGTEEQILDGIGLMQRSSGSSAFARMERAGWIVNLQAPDGSKLKARNRSSRLAMVRGLPEHQDNPVLIESLLLAVSQ